MYTYMRIIPTHWMPRERTPNLPAGTQPKMMKQTVTYIPLSDALGSLGKTFWKLNSSNISWPFLSWSLISEMKTGKTGVLSFLFRMTAHSHLNQSRKNWTYNLCKQKCFLAQKRKANQCKSRLSATLINALPVGLAENTRT